jgi:hypothetical protein
VIMIQTCDVCKIETDDIRFDDMCGAFSGAYGYLCKHCYALNDTIWKFQGIKTAIQMEMQMNRRAFRRMRNEIVSV